MQQNVTIGLGGDLCGLLAKQTDEGNLSCSLSSIERGGGAAAAPTIVSVVTHLSRYGGQEGRKDGMSQQRRREGEEPEMGEMINN